MSSRPTHTAKLGQLAVAAVVLAGCGASPGEPFDSAEEPLTLTNETKLFIPKPNPDAVKQIARLKARHRRVEAARINHMIETPQAVWLTNGSRGDVVAQTREVVRLADDKGRVPVLVAYNIPFRDCSQFSAGGATTKEEYHAWVDGIADGIGRKDAIVILEPDSLGIIPWYNPLADRDDWLPDPNVLEWCQPTDADPATAAQDRFDMLKDAVETLKSLPNTKVYLDGTHTAWLAAGDAADRLLQAGVTEADGFFLNASNYQDDPRLEKYGAWVAKCIWFADPTSGSWGAGHAEWCNSQYYPATFDDLSTWALTDQWYTDNVESQTWVPYPGDEGISHFVIDTSRNGVGPWQATPEQLALGDVQDWCNPPGRGLGKRPTTNTGNPLIDAYLWIKLPGESDGQCNRWDPVGSPDPVRNTMDPAAGAWFPQMALELTANANPPF